MTKGREGRGPFQTRLSLGQNDTKCWMLVGSTGWGDFDAVGSPAPNEHEDFLAASGSSAIDEEEDEDQDERRGQQGGRCIRNVTTQGRSGLAA